MNTLLKILLAISIFSFVKAKVSSEQLASANDPLSNITAFNIQAYQSMKLSGQAEDQQANSYWLRYAQGGEDYVFRISTPIVSQDTANGYSVNGIGDTNAFFMKTFNSSPGNKWGVGPLVVLPTETANVGQDFYQLGGSIVYFNSEIPWLQWGGLLTWQWSIAEKKSEYDLEDVETGVFQAIYIVQLGGGLYTGGAPVWTYNPKTGDMNIPLGLRIGKIAKLGDTVVNIFAEYESSVYYREKTTPQLTQQIYLAMNLQFY